MCGIAGIWGAGSRNRGLLEGMASSLRHRGPDDEGLWLDEAAGLALVHRRLAVVDLSSQGQQPMLSSDGRWAISYNGEIYNHLEIRRDLEQSGRAPAGGWRGHSDTETLVEAIAVMGVDRVLPKLVGMFAFALWDRRERVLHLVRDRFGEKPLYFGWIGRDFLFASELKALRRYPDFDPPLDEEALAAYFAITAIPAPMTIYRGIYKLMPGSILSLHSGFAPQDLPAHPRPGFESSKAIYRSYWNYPDLVEAGSQKPFASHADALAGLDHALDEAIEGQKMADVPLGVFLSGGIDSSTIAALQQRHSSRPISTFTIGFSEPGYNEAPFARSIAKYLGTDHHEMIVTPAEARDVIPELAAIYDEPFADSSQIPTLIVSRFARRSVTVALSGDGGDELFAGYNRHLLASRFWQRVAAWPGWLRRGGGALASWMPDAFWSTSTAIGSRSPVFAQKVRKGATVLRNARSLSDVYASFLDEWYGQPAALRSGRRWSPALPALPDRVDDAAKLACWDAMSYLPDDILVKVDRASMAASLETLAPFLDHRVAEVAARVPMAMKIDSRGGKAILRDLLGQYVPPELFERPKTGFGIPVGQWLRGPLRDWAEHLLDPRRTNEGGWLDAKVVRARWADHLSGKRGSTAAIWSILMFEAWRELR